MCNLKNELQMKSMILSFLILLIVSSCTDTEKLTELENRIAKIENQNKVLVGQFEFCKRRIH